MRVWVRTALTSTAAAAWLAEDTNRGAVKVVIHSNVASGSTLLISRVTTVRAAKCLVEYPRYPNSSLCFPQLRSSAHHDHHVNAMATTETKPPLGRYELYKSGTEKIFDCLVKNACHCIDVTPFISTEGTKSGNKIKARALVSSAKAIAAAHEPASQPSAAIVVTPTITKLLLEVIDGRKVSAEWYIAQPASDELQDANRSHAFFIDILQKVHRLLVSVEQPSKVDS